MNLRDLILAAADIRKEPVTVPEWRDSTGEPVTVYVKTMTAAERLAWAEDAFDDAGNAADRFKERLLIHTLVDGQGAAIFTDADVDALAGKSGAVVLRLFAAAKAANSMGEEAVETAVKNS